MFMKIDFQDRNSESPVAERMVPDPQLYTSPTSDIGPSIEPLIVSVPSTWQGELEKVFWVPRFWSFDCTNTHLTHTYETRGQNETKSWQQVRELSPRSSNLGWVVNEHLLDCSPRLSTDCQEENFWIPCPRMPSWVWLGWNCSRLHKCRFILCQGEERKVEIPAPHRFLGLDAD